MAWLSLELGAERYTCRNMFGFGYSQNSVSESNLFAEIPNLKLMPKSETNAEIPNICRNPKHMPKFQTYVEIPTYGNICQNH